LDRVKQYPYTKNVKNETIYVLIHGSGLGGWCWDAVKTRLEKTGARVYAPTLPDESQTLADNVKFIADFIESRNISNCILVGHSFGGMIITGVYDRLKNRIAKLIYLDAAVPRHGDDFASHIPDISNENAQKRRRAFKNLSTDGVWIQPFPPERAGISDQNQIDHVASLSRPFPLKTWLEPIELAETVGIDVAKTYILATSPPTDLMGYPQHGEIAKQSPDWTYREIPCGHAAMIIKPDHPCGHAAMIIKPDQVAELLLE